MTKKSNTKATTKKAKGKASSAEQLKIAGTGRLDVKPAIEKAAHDYQAKVAARDQAEVAEDDAQAALTESLIDAKISEYVYEGKDGIMYCAYVPKKKEPKAKVRKIKRNKPDLGDGEH
jgi:hypothetical protein